MSQNDSNLHTIYCNAPIDKMLFTQCPREGQLIPSVLVTYADEATRDVFAAILKELHTSQQWSHDLIITDLDVSIFFHCRELSPTLTQLLIGNFFTKLPNNTEIVFDCSADFDRETIEMFRKNYDGTDILLFQIVNSFDNIDNGKLMATTLAELTLPVSKAH